MTENWTCTSSMSCFSHYDLAGRFFGVLSGATLTTGEIAISAPLRIRRDTSKGVTGETENIKPYMDRLLKLIPAEVLSLYAVGSGILPDGKGVIAIVWALFCLAAVLIVKAFGTADKRRNLAPDWIHVSLSMIAFAIWVYYLGGPFLAWPGYSKAVGSLLILAFTFVSPYLYRGPADA